MAIQHADDPHGSYEERYGWHDPASYAKDFTPHKGLNQKTVEEISFLKSEPAWMRKFRLKAFDRWERRPIPKWGADLGGLDFQNIYYFMRATDKQERSWDEVPADIKKTFDRLGIPEAEQKYLGGVSAQYESETVYHKIKDDLSAKGVIFTDMDTAVREYPDIVRKYLATVIPPNDNKLAALNSAVWSGGCLTANARVNVRGKGFTSIADIEAGDEVFGADLSRNLERGKVLAKIASGVKPVYRISVAGRSLEATGNHKFLVARRVAEGRRTRWVATWAPLDEIEVGEPIAIARILPDDGESQYLPAATPYLKNHSRQNLELPEKTSVDLCWLLGLWLGDGHTAAPHEHMRQITFSIPTTDPVHQPAIAGLREVFDVEHVTQVGCGFLVSSKELGVWLEELGFGGLAKTKRLPAWVYTLPHEQQLAILGGLVDSDGWTEREGKSMCIELANRELLEDVRQLAIACGLFADGIITERTRTATFADGRTVTATCWRLRIHGDLARVGTRDPKKAGLTSGRWRRNAYQAATGLNFGGLVTPTVGFAVLRSKDFVGELPTFDIQVVGLENFVANGIVAHNSFIYVPPGVRVDVPLQAYFRINAENMGQFERTLIIADEGSYVHYVEGCTAPVYSSESLHSAVVELIAMPNARIRYTTIQNWAGNVYNLVTKRAVAHENAVVEWVDGNLGSKVTMKYPAVVLMGRKAHGEVLSLAMAGAGQHQDTGAKMTHVAPETTSTIVSKSISKDGGRTSYRGWVRVEPTAEHSKSNVRCDALLIDEDSRSDTYPRNEIWGEDVEIGHEATVARIGDDQMFYLMSRGIPEAEAAAMIVRGFIEPITKQLPMEYAVELNRLIELQMEGSVG
jgi:Fe-S cluster assembly protein SufB